MGKNNGYTIGNLLNYDYFLNYYKLIAIDFSKKIELRNPDAKQQINVIGRLDGDNEAAMFFIIKKLEGTTFEFFCRILSAFFDLVWFLRDIYIYIYERETSVCMYYTITVKQKAQRLFDEFSYSFNT